MRCWFLPLFYFPVGDRPAVPVLRQQFSISELVVCRGDTPNYTVGLEETGLQEHTEENCLYCVGAIVLGYPTQPQINSTHPPKGELSHAQWIIHVHLKLSVESNNYPLSFFLPDYVDFASWGGQSGHRLEVMPQSKFSGVSGCSDAAVSQGSICSTPTPGDIVIGKTIVYQEMQVVVWTPHQTNINRVRTQMWWRRNWNIYYNYCVVIKVESRYQKTALPLESCWGRRCSASSSTSAPL